jgi:hypothetical protein
MASAVTIYREQRGACLIEARARDLHDGSHWQPWLKLTHSAGAASACRTFDRLKPVFGTENAALHYAAELGRSLVDEGSVLVPASGDQKTVDRPLQDVFARPFAFLARARSFAFANCIFQVRP